MLPVFNNIVDGCKVSENQQQVDADNGCYPGWISVEHHANFFNTRYGRVSMALGVSPKLITS